MKGRNTYILGFLLLILVLFAGCTSKPLKEPTGPKWDTNYTFPVIIRNKDNGAQIFLDDEVNVLGEEGLGLQGKNLKQFKSDFEEFGYFTVEVDDLDIPPIPLSLVPPGTSVPINATTKFEIPEGLFKINLSDRTKDDGDNPVNTIDIVMDGATAGTEGVTITLTDAEGTEYKATINAGEDSTALTLDNAVLGSGTMELEVSGTAVIAGTDNLKITFSPTTLEVTSMTVSSEKLGEMLDMEEEEEIEIELGDVGLEFTALSFTFLSEHMPANLRATLELRVEGRAEDGTTVVGTPSNTLSLILEREKESTLDLATVANLILAEDPYYLVFVIEDIKFSTTEDEVTINYDDGIDLTVIHSIGLRTKPEAGEVDELEEDLIQGGRLVMKIDNHSPLGFKLTVYLSPNDKPFEDPNRVEKVVEIAPSTTGQSVELAITAAEISYLTSTGMLWNQIEVENTSDDGEIKEGDCLEITAYAEVVLRIDSEKMREEE